MAAGHVLIGDDLGDRQVIEAILLRVLIFQQGIDVDIHLDGT